MPIRPKLKANPNDVEAYKMGFKDGMKVSRGQAETTLEFSGDPGVPPPGDAIGAYNKGRYDAALQRVIARNRKK